MTRGQEVKLTLLSTGPVTWIFAKESPIVDFRMDVLEL
jgi:hypothetical protein